MPEDKKEYYPLLPKLRKNSNLSNFTKAGIWDNKKADQLQTLSNDLEVEKIDSKYFEIDSIPDVWARPLLFEMALYNKEHPLHNRVLGEWRGLIAMVALKELRIFNELSVKEITLPEPVIAAKKGEGEEDMQTERERPDFLNVLAKLKPMTSLSRDTLWNNIYVILFNREPIGIASPTTLVCTAANYYDRIHGVPWFDGRFLLNPTKFLNPEEKQVLASWLNKIKEGIANHPGINNPQNLLTIIGDDKDGFIKDLGGKPPYKDFTISDTSLEMTKGVFRYIAPIKAEEAKMVSHVKLLISKSKKEKTISSLLVVDRAIAEQWGMKGQDVKVYGTITLDRAVSDCTKGAPRNIIVGKPLKDTQWRIPDDLFTEKLFVIEQDDAFPGAKKCRGSDTLLLGSNSNLITPILPIKNELIDYLDPADLSDRIIFQKSDDDIIVRLRLPLSGADTQDVDKGKDFEISRKFQHSKGDIVYLSNVPILEVWPNFTRKGWKAYYTYCNTRGADKTFYATPYTAGCKSDIRPFKNNRQEIECGISKMEVFPEIMICEARIANPHINRMDSLNAGIIIITEPEDKKIGENTLRIGIDFGTTSTNIYLKPDMEKQTPSPFSFLSLFLRVTASGADRSQLYDNFLPGNPEPLPFLSVFHEFEKWDDYKKYEKTPLFNGHIYFFDENHYKKFDANSQNIFTNLKWSEKAGDRNRVELFLRQVCLQAAAEAVIKGAKDIRWLYSFPTAFDAKQIQGYPQIWGGVVKDCNELTGLGVKEEGEIENKIESRTESIASSLYFRDAHGASTTHGTVCIDMGGSTSDMAIWQKDKLLWQTSLRFAGRDIFLDMLHKYPSFLKVFDIDIPPLEKAINNRIAFYAQADAIIKRETVRLFDRLPIHAANEKVRGFIKLIAVALSGLFYYVGLLLRYLAVQGEYEKKLPDVYIGGNASRMFHWLDAGRYTIESDINLLFKTILLQASGFDDGDFKIEISKNLKDETAYGLVCDPMLDSNEYTDSGFLAGEKFVEGREIKQWEEMLTSERLKKGIEIPKRLEHLEGFFDSFNKYLKSNPKNAVVTPIPVDNQLILEIKKRLSTTLSDFKKKDEGLIHVEPLFILALKSFLEIETERWASE
jgi:hypothetical protein